MYHHHVESLLQGIVDSRTENTLHGALSAAREAMGFHHFAVSYDLRTIEHDAATVLLHDYPAEWAKVYVSFDLAGKDPVRRACDKTLYGFEWGNLADLIPMTPGDRQMLAIGREVGVADGYTTPRHIPGEGSGSCSFVVSESTALPRTMLFTAEILGAVALGAARSILVGRQRVTKPVISDRQRECILWSARGKTAGETGTILGISEETVIQHLKLARERYDVHTRQSLVLSALFDGIIGFRDIFRGRWRPK
ncbi:DNA-binding CsgD family transcriptional regulator [Novosphingobium hassiacum]|uniref:DNA-binding CsgD family transcriptional regulator n=1 Tax=Novosphingobium hassiacum TaxID=173676 RepID=A0A7W6EW49_9SPHN|nr:LuxR family transcriptional regulator [Novosphingobium hassiacum]MBB3860866.1 DNA-binding CsgD family transcriptional regulator [Novosphingobium hassiacum]